MLRYRPVGTNQFCVYIEGVKQISVASGIEIPQLTMKTDELDGAGVSGVVEIPFLGQYESVELKIPFTSLSREATQVLNTKVPHEVCIRSAQQGVELPGNSIIYGLEVTARGVAKDFEGGSFEKAAKMETEVTLECLYFKMVLEGETVFELDKLNGINVVNGEDVLEEVRRYC